MVLEVVYKKSSEEVKKNIEKRKLEESFNALADEFVPEGDKSYNKKYNHLLVVHKRYKNKSITQQILEGISF